MLHQSKSFAFGLILLCGLGAARPVVAGSTVPLRGTGDGQILLQVDPTPEERIGFQVYRFDGVGNVIGRFTGGGITLFTADGNVVGGLFVATAADGSTISESYTGTFAPIDGTPDFIFMVDQQWGDGTGRLAGVTGHSKTVAVVDGLTGAFTADAVGTWNLP